MKSTQASAIINKRIAYFDVIRIFACICIVVVHFNATVSGYTSNGFIYPNNGITPSFFLNGSLYLGDIGVSLFFMLSGSTLMYTYRSGNVLGFYRKRVYNIFPMFWIAYIIASMIDFMIYKGMSSESPLLLLFSVVGMDGYLCNLGMLNYAFYKLGEWFLGCIIILYIIFPLLHLGVEKHLRITCVLTIGLYIFYIKGAALLAYSINGTEFFLRIPEILFGMLVVKVNLIKKPRIFLGVGFASLVVGLVFKDKIFSLSFCILICIFLFSCISCLSLIITNESIKCRMGEIANLTYPIFLVHHWLINHMITGFSLEYLPRRSVYMLFVIYIILTMVCAWGLSRGAKILSRRFIEIFRNVHA